MVGAASAHNQHLAEHSPAVALEVVRAASAEKITERVRPRVRVIWMLINNPGGGKQNKIRGGVGVEVAMPVVGVGVGKRG